MCYLGDNFIYWRSDIWVQQIDWLIVLIMHVGCLKILLLVWPSKKELPDHLNSNTPICSSFLSLIFLELGECKWPGCTGAR